MSGPTLIDELRRKAKEDVEALWRKTRADADAYRAERSRANEEERARAAQKLASSAADFAAAATIEAERTARTNRAAAKAAFANRLFRLAVEALPDLGSENLFAALAAELPSREWQRVIVNPADRDAAQRLFPHAEVVCNPAIAGGMDVEADAGRIRVSNTLESRLQAAWPEILPGLMTEILAEVSHS
jgi:vacuolar-type H+-ATPase subunit E/Vma4